MSSRAGAPRVRAIALAAIALLLALAAIASTTAAKPAHPFDRLITGTAAGPWDRGLCGLGIDPVSEELYLLDYGHDSIDVLDNEGSFVRRISAADSPGTFSQNYGAGPSCGDRGYVAVNHDSGQVMVAESFSFGNPKTVRLFDSGGIFEKFVDGSTTPQGRFGTNQTGGTIDRATGNLLVSGTEYPEGSSGKVSRLTPTGQFIAQIEDGLGYPKMVETDSAGTIYVLDRDVVRKFDPAGNPIEVISGTGYSPLTNGGEIDRIAVGADDHLYVLGAAEGRRAGESWNDPVIYEFDQSGALVSATKGVAVAGGLRDRPIVGMVADKGGHVFLAINDGAGGYLMVFDPVATVPDATAEAATEIGHTSVTLNGTVNPLSDTLPVECEFEYGGGGDKVPCTPALIPPGSGPVPVSAKLSGLETGNEIRYRVIARNANGFEVSYDQVVFPPFVLDVETNPVTAIGRTSATFNGSLNPDGKATTYYFEYGTEPFYGETVPAPPGAPAGSGTVSVPVDEPVTGLLPGTTYHVRLDAENVEGLSRGNDVTFTTAAAVKDVVTEAATAVTRNGATLNGSFDPAGEATSYYFEYGLDASYGQTAPAAPKSGGSGSGSTPGSELIAGLQPGTTYHYRIVAENAVGTTRGEDVTFSTPPAVLGVTTTPATAIDLDSATLNGSFDPDGQATKYFFQYGVGGKFSNQAPADPVDGGSGSDPVNVSFDLAGLSSGTTYQYRLVAENASGATLGNALTFSTPELPGIQSVSSSNLGETVADLHARIDNHGEEARYRFEYGTTLDFGSVAPVPDGILAPSGEVQQVTLHLEDLQPFTTYYFRVVAENKWGTRTSPNQTFSFAPPDCPNALVRQQTGANYLPDCRAYELVTPASAGGVTLAPAGPSSAFGDSRLAYNGSLGLIREAGDPPNFLRDLYVATRSSEGWRTRHVGVPARESLITGARFPEFSPATIPTNLSMDRFITWDNGYRGFCLPTTCDVYAGHNAPWLYDSDGNRLARLPSNWEDYPNFDLYEHDTHELDPSKGDQAASGDLTHFVFGWNKEPVFAEGGLLTDPGSVYDNDVAAKTTVVASVLPGGGPIPQEPGGPEMLEITNIDQNGSHILIAAPTGPKERCLSFGCTPDAPERLYLRVDQAVTYDVTGGHYANYLGMTPDGERVLFESEEQVTADDEDESADIFAWDEGTKAITRVSGSGGNGNSDECNATWTEKCDAVIVRTEGGATEPGLGACPCADERRSNKDNSISRGTGEAWFYSPEQLDGAKGFTGEANLYTVVDGEVRYVATPATNRPLTRIQVSPDNGHAALLTSSRLTAFDNAGLRQMYTYDTALGAIRCVSCPPGGQAPTFDVETSQQGFFMADDGRTFFTTADALVPKDTNNLRDSYEFVDGRAQLISTGTAAQDIAYAGLAGIAAVAGIVGVSADGRDVYFGTFDSIVDADQNGPRYKIYDARTGGGFPFDPPLAPCVAADECHGPGSPEPALPPVSTEARVKSGNRARPPGKKARKCGKARKAGKSCKKGKPKKSKRGKGGRR